MDNKEYENKYRRTTIVLRVLGFIFLPIGIILIGIGMSSFFSTFGSGEMPSGFYLVFAGFPFFAAGGACLTLGFRRKMTEFMVTTTAPVMKDFSNYMIDGTSDSVSKVAGKIAKEIKGNNGAATVEGVTANTCSKCGHVNPANASFCAKCGAPLTKVCPHCGATNDDGAKFCNSCGRELF